MRPRDSRTSSARRARSFAESAFQRLLTIIAAAASASHGTAPMVLFSARLGLAVLGHRAIVASGQSRGRAAALRPTPRAGSESCASSGAASVTSVGVRPFSTVSLVTTHFFTSRREGSSNCTSSRISSMIERRPRAPVSRSRPFSATAVSESSENTSSIPSKEKKRWNCLTSALRGSVEDRDQVVARELVHGRHDRQAADELGDQPVLDQVLGQAVLEHLARVAFGLASRSRRRSRRPCGRSAARSPCRGSRTRRRR